MNIDVSLLKELYNLLHSVSKVSLSALHLKIPSTLLNDLKKWYFKTIQNICECLLV